MKTRNSKLEFSAFTLAETLFAMAILSFTVLTIVGLMPSGLSNLQNAERTEAEARIYQSLASEYDTKPWSELKSFTRSNVTYYDSTGLPLSGSTDEMAYAAMVEAQTGGIHLPQMDASPYLLGLTIAISNHPRDNSVSMPRNRKGQRREFGLVIVNQDSDK